MSPKSDFDFAAYSGGSGSYITAAEKQVIAENGIPFQITAIRKVFKFEKDHYDLSILLPNPANAEEEDRVLSFAIGSGAESRDASLAGLEKHFDDGGEPKLAKLEKIGRGYYLRNA